jgi:mRNA interferase MazF
VSESPQRGQPVCHRGDVVLVDLDENQRRGSQSGTRPCVVVQNDIGNSESPHTIVVPIGPRNANKKSYPVNVEINPPEGVKIESYVDCGQLHTVPWHHIQRVLGKISPETLVKIEQALRISLQL